MSNILQPRGSYLPSTKNIVLSSPSSRTEYEEYFQFRWQHLRRPLGLARGSEQDEYENVSYHCVAFDSNKKIIGVGRITPCSNNDMQIRYMAVSRAYRKIGVGSMILKELLLHAKEQGADRCWLNARVGAVAFYQKNGFEVVRKVDTCLAIAHFLMQIELNVSRTCD